jgi:hypothetical protein
MRVRIFLEILRGVAAAAVQVQSERARAMMRMAMRLCICAPAVGVVGRQLVCGRSFLCLNIAGGSRTHMTCYWSLDFKSNASAVSPQRCFGLFRVV